MKLVRAFDFYAAKFEAEGRSEEEVARLIEDAMERMKRGEVVVLCVGCHGVVPFDVDNLMDEETHEAYCFPCAGRVAVDAEAN